VLLAAAPAFAEDGAAMLGKAQQAIDNIDYENARALTDQALASGSLGPKDLARAHMLAGEIAAALGDDAGAHDHFERWILLAPDAALPSGQSPKITQPFTAAHASADALGPARFDVSATRNDGKLALAITGDPLHMVARVHVGFDRGSDGEGVGDHVEVAIDDAATHANVALLDEHGNTLAERSVDVAAATAAAPAGLREIVHHSIPAPLRWPTWTALAVVGAGATAYFAHAASKDQSDLDALNASSGMHTFDEAKAIEDRGKRDTLFTGVAIAAAAAVVVTVVVDHRTVEVQPLAAPGATGASVSLHF
jgi:hypothetical protein